MLEELEQKITELAILDADELGLELVEVKLKKHRETYIVGIITDKPTGGISIDECTRLNKQVSQRIEEEWLLGEFYTIDVSSPGLDRPLKTDKDFKRNVGREVGFYLNSPVCDKVTWTGIVCGVEDDCVLVKTNEEGIKIPLTNIDKALQVLTVDFKGKKNKDKKRG